MGGLTQAVFFGSVKYLIHHDENSNVTILPQLSITFSRIKKNGWPKILLLEFCILSERIDKEQDILEGLVAKVLARITSFLFLFYWKTKLKLN